MQRIVERGQIETNALRQLRRIREPDPDRTFAGRARRLRALSAGHSIAGYLSLMADLADAQHAIAKDLSLDARALSFVASTLPLDPLTGLELLPWRAVMTDLCQQVLQKAALPSGARTILERIESAAKRAPGDGWLVQQARALLEVHRAAIDRASAPFLMAAMQVCWAHVAAERISSALPQLEAQTSCPVCARAPVAGIIAVDGDAAGYRFLHCSLCSSEWHYVRAQCSQCGSGGRITYRTLQGERQDLRAECCDECSTYLKVVYPEHDNHVEPVADDLATLALDLLLSDAGYSRVSTNPLYWQE